MARKASTKPDFGTSSIAITGFEAKLLLAEVPFSVAA